MTGNSRKSLRAIALLP